MSFLEFTPLASSSAGCAYRLGANGATALLLDCGLPFDKIQKGLRFGVAQLAGCLLTHAHGDHSKSARDLMRFGVDVYATAPTFDALGLAGQRRAKIVEPYKSFAVAGWQITPISCKHDADGTVGYLIQRGEFVALYLTDTAYTVNTFEGLTHLFVECNHSAEVMRENTRSGGLTTGRFDRVRNNHMSIETLECMLRANDLSRLQEVWLLHLSDQNSDEVEFKRRVQAITGTPVYVAAKHGQAVPF